MRHETVKILDQPNLRPLTYATRTHLCAKQVLEVEPWSLEFHDRKTGEAWRECGRRVPEYLKEDGRTDHGMLVQRKVVRMCRRLQEPAAKTLWKSETEVTRRLVEVAAGLATTRRYKDEFGMNQQQEPVEPKNVDVSR